MSSSLTDVAAAVVLLTLAVVLTLSGLFTDRALPLIAGVGLVVIAALGAASTRVSIRAAGVEITIERQLPVVNVRPPSVRPEHRSRETRAVWSRRPARGRARRRGSRARVRRRGPEARQARRRRAVREQA